MENFTWDPRRRVCSNHFNLDATGDQYIPVCKVNRSRKEILEIFKRHDFALLPSELRDSSSASGDSVERDEEGRLKANRGWSLSP